MNETEIIQHPQIDGLRIFFDTVDYRTPHVHEEFELIWLMEGRLSVQAGPFRHVAQSGEMVLFDPQQTHEFHKVEESCTFLCLQVAPTMLAGCFPAIRNIRTGGVCPGIYLSPDVFAQVQRGLLNVYTPRAEAYHYESKSRGLDTLSENAKRYEREKANFYAKYQQYIDNYDPYYNPHFNNLFENFGLK